MNRFTRHTLVILCAFLLANAQPSAAFTTDQQEDICANSWVIYCENFEDRQLGKSDLSRQKYKNIGWATSNFTGMGVVNDDKFDGTKSFKFIYPINGSSGFMDTKLGNSYRDVYFRLYTRWSSNWVLSAIAEKHLEPEGGYAAFLFHNVFAGALSTVSDFSNGTFAKWPPNLGSGDATLHGSGQTAWNCLEGHIRMNSGATTTDGLVESWYNGVQRISVSDVNVSTQRTDISTFMLSGYWNCIADASGCVYTDPRSLHPEMYRWHDNIVVGTQRIGCLGSTTDSTPPAAPASLRISSLWNWLASIIYG